jgi:hypothetical protein
MLDLKRLLLLPPLAVLAGCSGSADNAFIGTWKATSGTTTRTCNGTMTTLPLASNNTDSWASGSNATIVLTNEFGSLNATVSGSTATLSTGSGVWLEAFPGDGAVSPSTDVAAGTFSGNVSVTDYTFALGSDGKSATETYAGTVSVAEDGGTAPCAVTETASYEKLAD